MTPSEETVAAATGYNTAPQSWPADLEITVEYCTRSPFHARYDPDKYLHIFEMVRDAFLARSAQTKIAGNPFTGRRQIVREYDKYGPLQEEVDLPRLGAFEVSVNSAQTGCVTIFSKLELRRWPNPPILVVQVDRLLRGEPLLQPLPPRDRGDSNSPRKPVPQATESSSYWMQKTNTTSTASTPRSPRSPERSEAVKTSPKVSPKKVKASPKKRTSGNKETSSTQEAVRPAADSKGEGVASATRPKTAESNSEFEDAQYGADDFEGDESGEGSSCFGTKVWMPGAAKEEKWEEDIPSRSGSKNENLEERVMKVQSPVQAMAWNTNVEGSGKAMTAAKAAK